MTINHQSASASDPSFEVVTNTGSAVTITGEGSVILVYDASVTGKWILTTVLQ